VLDSAPPAVPSNASMASPAIDVLMKTPWGISALPAIIGENRDRDVTPAAVPHFAGSEPLGPRPLQAPCYYLSLLGEAAPESAGSSSPDLDLSRLMRTQISSR